MVNIDGTDISSATIDGTDVQEITIDGNVAWTAGVGAIPNSVIAHWKMNEGSGSTVSDNEGTYDGTLSGANWQSGDGAGGYSVSLDGTDDTIPLDNGLPFSSGEAFSYAIWIKPDSVTPTDARIDIFGNGGARRNIEIGGTSTIRLKGYDGIDQLITGNTSLSAGNWYLVGAAFDGSTARININGSDDGSGSWGYDEGTYDDGFTVRAGNATGTDYYDGLIGEGFVFNASLSESEFQDIYDLTKGDYA